jgi:ribA/ribD-fused uncharacterized protein
VEQFMMYAKAKLFGDEKIALEILQTNSPQAAKVLGRKIKGYVDQVWKEKRRKIVFIGNREKYRQNPPLLSLLLMTVGTILVEASERDTDWGVGLHENDDRVADPEQWLGNNLHGDIQMEVREYFLQQRDSKKLADNTVIQGHNERTNEEPT